MNKLDGVNRKGRSSLSNLALFSVGRLISLLGTFMFHFAAGLYVLKLTGSGMQFALTLIVATVPRIILSPFAGVLADRVNRKWLVVWMDLLSGLVMLTLIAVSGSRSISVMGIYVAMVCLTICNTLFDVAMEAARPGIVETSYLEKLNAISTGIGSFSSIVGPILGGVVFGLIDFKVFVLANGISFILSGILECFINFELNTELAGSKASEDKGPEAKFSFKEDISEGVKYLKDSPLTLLLMLFSLCINFSFTLSLTVPLPYLFSETYGLSSTWIGIVNSGFPIGFLIGAGIITIKPIKRKMSAFYFSVLGIWIGFMMMSAVMIFGADMNGQNVAELFTLLMGILGFSVAYLDIPLMTVLQKMIPSEVRGRVMSLFMMASRTATPLAMIIAGQSLNMAHPKWLLFAGASLYSIQLIIFVKGQHLRKFKSLMPDEEVLDKKRLVGE